MLGHAPAAQRGALSPLIHAASAAGLNGAFVLAGLLGIAGGIVAILTMRRPAAPPQPAAGQAASRLSKPGHRAERKLNRTCRPARIGGLTSPL